MERGGGEAELGEGGLVLPEGVLLPSSPYLFSLLLNISRAPGFQSVCPWSGSGERWGPGLSTPQHI